MPYEGEHSCRLKEPSQFAEFRRKNNERSSGGKKYDVIYGIKKGKSEEASYRYSKKIWSEKEAKSHCSSHKGRFEPAKKETTSMIHLEKLHWAILSDALTDILNKANDNIEAFFDVGEDALTPVKKDSGVATLNINGVIFGRSNILSLLGMGVSIENLEHQFAQAQADTDVKEIKFIFDTPGGVFQSTNKFAEKIFASRGKKPMTSIVTGTCASAGYLIASATDSIQATDETNLIGAIGVILPVSPKNKDERVFISSNAPRKTPDPDSTIGLEVYQGIVDRLEAVFIEKLARNRGVSTSYVKESFGKGDILLAKEAIKAKMINSLSNYNGGDMEITAKILKDDYKAVYDEIVNETAAQFTGKDEEITALNTKVEELTAEITALQAKIPEEEYSDPKAREAIAKVEKELLSTKLSGCLEDVQTALVNLHGKASIDEIMAIGKLFTDMQAKIDEIGKPLGSISDEDVKLQDQINAKVKELTDAGMSQTDAYTKACDLYM